MKLGLPWRAMEDGDSCHRSGNVNPQITQRYLRLNQSLRGIAFVSLRVDSCGFVDRRPRNDNSTIHETTLNTTKFLLLCGKTSLGKQSCTFVSQSAQKHFG
jgi:hypothetical protein